MRTLPPMSINDVHAFTVQYKLTPRGKTITGQRFYANLEVAQQDCGVVVQRETAGRGKLISVHQTTEAEWHALHTGN